MKKGYLILQDGQVFEGVRFGAETDTVGELVFTTGMCGYVETLTDPSYAGQIVMQTYPLIGNYGIIREDFEGACCVKGYVVREYCGAPSNFRTDCDLDTFLKERGRAGAVRRGHPGADPHHPGARRDECRHLRRDPRRPDPHRDLRRHRRGGGCYLHGARRPSGGGGGAVPGVPAGLRRQAQHCPGAPEAGLHRDGPACDHLRGGDSGRGPGRRHALQRPRRPGGKHVSDRADPQSFWARCPCSASAWATS